MKLASISAHLLPSAPADSQMADFSNEPWWVSIIKAVLIVVWLILSVIMVLWVERRGLGRVQTRPGPNWHGPLGLLQAIADSVKLLTKEDIWKSGADKLLYLAGPMIAAAAAFMVYGVIPFGPDLHFGSFTTPMQLTDTPVAVLYILAIASLGIYGIILGGWASSSTLPLLGATRSAAQVISYELAMGMSLVTVFVVSGSMSTSEIVAAQTPVWWCVALLPAFVIYLISMVGEINRLPFDMPECEGEIVAGHMTEYSSMKFAWFFLAEYINMFNVAGVATTLFLGGWRLPYGDVLFGGVLHQYGLPFIWFGIKVWAVVWCVIWVRGTLLRVRYDQLMTLGWKILLPISLVWFVMVAIIRVVAVYNLGTLPQRLGIISGIFLVLLIVLWIHGSRKEKQMQAEEEAREAALQAPFDAFKDGYPVPPLPGQVLPPSPRSLSRGAANKSTLSSGNTKPLTAEESTTVDVAVKEGDKDE